ncbi:phosphohydrolase [Kitasatospora sp. NPDC058965]|uniref:phosphohydrolase n=1 Tax=Kitasatospora sp. NPDC058965 TaxID=3346682 RepID=UPI003692DBF4
MATLAEVVQLAERAHAGQVDKLGVPYVEHLRAVADGLAPFGEQAQMAGWLHDALEDTPLTAADLLAAGVPAAVVAAVQAVTTVPGGDYQERIRAVTADPLATLVKVSDNAHNSHPDRTAALGAEQRERLAAKYLAARQVLWAAADRADVAAILERVNPSLLAELPPV